MDQQKSIKKIPLFFNWSSGKDSCFALYKILKSGKFEVKTLFTSVNAENKRVSMHGLHEDLLKTQAKALNLPLEIMYLTPSSSMEVYNQTMQVEMQKFKDQGILNTAFGDIFLEDLKEYREQQLAKVGIKAHFPLWKMDTKKLILDFLDLGFKTVVVSANAKWFSEDFVGSTLTKELIEALPEGVDPCGENGKFHTFCYNGPLFRKTVDFKIGDKIKRSYPDPSNKDQSIDYWFCDLQVQ